MEHGQFFGNLDALAEALEALLGGHPFRGQSLAHARLLEQRATLDQDAVRLGPTVAGAGQDVAITLELCQRMLTLLDGGPGLVDRFFGDLQPARVLGTLGVEVEQRPLESPFRPRGSAVDARDPVAGPICASRSGSR
jgi:hypothetical protein